MSNYLGRSLDKRSYRGTISTYFVPAMALVLIILVATPTRMEAFAEESDSNVQFVSNSEMIKGHISQAVANKEKSDIPLAKAHSGHPIAEHYSKIESRIGMHNPQLNSELKASLGGLAAKVDTSNIEDFRAETERIGRLLDQAVSDVIPSNETMDIKFNAQVIIAILTQTEKEYEEAIHDGKIIDMVEYQDAQAFRVRANTIFNQISDKLSPHELEIATDFFRNLESSMDNTEEVGKIEAEINGLINEISEGAGIAVNREQGSEEVSTIKYIQNVRDLLKQISIEYKRGNFTGAEELATTAYLDNFEHVEIELVKHNATDLKAETEQMLRIELREAIRDRVAADEIDAEIAAINAKLDEAVTVVPEFPVSITIIIMATVIGMTIFVSRNKGRNQ